MSVLVRRSDLVATYAQPYRRWVPVVMRGYGAHWVALVAVLLLVLGVVVQASGGAGGLLVVGAAAMVSAACYALWTAATGVRMVRANTEEWRRTGGELARVRRRRPHAAEADPDVVHTEYAVAVSHDGGLVTFAYHPLASYEEAGRGADLIPGVPRYEAFEHSIVEFDPVDAGRAAEQLAEAQDHAARLEAAAIERARADLAMDDEARELAAEARSTGEALREITGQ
jgi:hypothetical protein